METVKWVAFRDNQDNTARLHPDRRYWLGLPKIDDNLQHLESRTGNVMGASGGLFSVRRELYPEFPDTVQDDFTVSMSVVFRGKRLIKARDVIAFERTVSRRDEELRRKVRIGARAFHTHRFLWPQIAQLPHVIE